MLMDLAIRLGGPEKLIALQEVDQHRPWTSLNDKRRCVRCGRLISGRQIKIVVDEDGGGPLRGQCPTRNCGAPPVAWAFPRDDDSMIPGAAEPALQSPFPSYARIE